MPDLDDEEYRATRKLNGVEQEEDKEIQVGEYARTSAGKLFKVSEIVLGNIPKDEKGTMIVTYITNHNPNLIQLIEVGDYVNGMLVQKIAEPSFVNDYKKLIYCNECEGLYKGIFDNNDIKSIVTHEQFNSVMYKVKE